MHWTSGLNPLANLIFFVDSRVSSMRLMSIMSSGVSNTSSNGAAQYAHANLLMDAPSELKNIRDSFVSLVRKVLDLGSRGRVSTWEVGESKTPSYLVTPARNTILSHGDLLSLLLGSVPRHPGSKGDRHNQKRERIKSTAEAISPPKKKIMPSYLFFFLHICESGEVWVGRS